MDDSSSSPDLSDESFLHALYQSHQSNFQSLENFEQSPENSRTIDFTPNNDQSVDEILDNVQRMMLNDLNVVEIDNGPLSSADLVGQESPKTPKTVEDLLSELCEFSSKSEMQAEIAVVNGVTKNDLMTQRKTANKVLCVQNELVRSLTKKNEYENNALLKSKHISVTVKSQQVGEKVDDIHLNSIKNFNSSKPAHKETLISTQSASEALSESQPFLKKYFSHENSPYKESITVSKLVSESGDMSAVNSLEAKKLKKSNSDMSNFPSKSFDEMILKDSNADHQTQKPASSKQDHHTKEKRKLKFTASLPDKLPTSKWIHKDNNQLHHLKTVLSLVKQPTRDKMQGELKRKQSIEGEVDCSCFGAIENKSKHNSIFSSEIICDDEDRTKTNNEKKIGGARRKIFWSKEKKSNVAFDRLESLEGKKSSTEARIQPPFFNFNEKLKSHLSLSEPGSIGDARDNGSPWLQRKLFKDQTSDLFGMIPPRSSRVKLQHSRSLNGSPYLRRLDQKDISFLPCDADIENTNRVDSEPKLHYVRHGEFNNNDEADRRRRATMDSAAVRPNLVNCAKKNQPGRFYTASIFSDHSTEQQYKQKRPFYGQVGKTHFANEFISSNNLSQENLDRDVLSSLSLPFSRSRGVPARAITEEELALLKSKTPKSSKKKLIRKSMKHIGKSASLATNEHDDITEQAERTWHPEGECTWKNLNGRTVDLGSTWLQSLSELECDALRKVSVLRLQELSLGVTIVVPKDESKLLNRKVSVKKKYAVHLPTKDKNRDKGFDHVFGIPLVNVVENDQLLRIQKFASLAPSHEFHQNPDSCADTTSPVVPLGPGSGLSSSNSSCTGSTSSIHNTQHLTSNSGDVETAEINRSLAKSSSNENFSNLEEGEVDIISKENKPSSHPQITTNKASTQPLRRRGAIGADPINEIEPYESQLLEALSLSVSGGKTAQNQRKEKKRSLLPPTMAQVPYVVQKCCDYLRNYGLDQTGIFRVAGSKKRVKQLREEFDRGNDVVIDETYNPHDVAALLKEFFRDLPEALLTRELYNAFLHTSKTSDSSQRLKCLQYLVWLLPLTNRDTLHTLLQFLASVAARSEDTTDRSGAKVPGNKMNVANLATIFGPNILNRYKKSSSSSSDNQYQVQSLEKAEENTTVIKVVEEIISNHIALFEIPKEDHDRMLRILKESDPEAVDFLLRRKAASHMRERSRHAGSNSSPVSRHKLPAVQTENDNNTNLAITEISKPDIEKSMSIFEVASKSGTLPQPDHVQAAVHDGIQNCQVEKQKGLETLQSEKCLVQRLHPKQFSEEQSTNKEATINDENNSSIKPDNTSNSTHLNADSVSLGSTISLNIENSRTMFFTDDDMRAIFAGKGSFNSLPPNKIIEEDKIGLENSFDSTLFHQSEISLKVECDKISLEEGDLRFPNEVMRGANSSDSGVYMADSYKNSFEFSDSFNRSDGFSLEKSNHMELNKALDEEKNAECSDDHLAEKLFDDEKNKLRKDSLFDNSSESSIEVVIDKNEDDSLKNSFLSRESMTIANDKGLNQRIYSTAQKMSEECLNSPNRDGKYLFTTKSQGFCISVAKEHSHNDIMTHNGYHKKHPNSVLKNSPNEEQLQETNLVSEKLNNLSENFNKNQSSKQLNKESCEKLTNTRRDRECRSSPRLSGGSPRGANVSKLMGQYNKNDVSLETNINSPPGSRWTSPGFVGTCHRKNNTITKQARNIENESSLKSGSCELAWQFNILDQKQLPETLV